MREDTLDTEGASPSVKGVLASEHLSVCKAWGMSREGATRMSLNTGNTNGRNVATENDVPMTFAISSSPQNNCMGRIWKEAEVLTVAGGDREDVCPAHIDVWQAYPPERLSAWDSLPMPQPAMTWEMGDTELTCFQGEPWKMLWIEYLYPFQSSYWKPKAQCENMCRWASLGGDCFMRVEPSRSDYCPLRKIGDLLPFLPFPTLLFFFVCLRAFTIC